MPMRISAGDKRFTEGSQLFRGMLAMEFHDLVTCKLITSFVVRRPACPLFAPLATSAARWSVAIGPFPRNIALR
jgi:hypothetical protein